jgi:hypothetical protein
MLILTQTLSAQPSIAWLVTPRYELNSLPAGETWSMDLERTVWPCF